MKKYVLLKFANLKNKHSVLFRIKSLMPIHILINGLKYSLNITYIYVYITYVFVYISCIYKNKDCIYRK